MAAGAPPLCVRASRAAHTAVDRNMCIRPPTCAVCSAAALTRRGRGSSPNAMLQVPGERQRQPILIALALDSQFRLPASSGQASPQSGSVYATRAHSPGGTGESQTGPPPLTPLRIAGPVRAASVLPSGPLVGVRQQQAWQRGPAAAAWAAAAAARAFGHGGLPAGASRRRRPRVPNGRAAPRSAALGGGTAQQACGERQKRGGWRRWAVRGAALWARLGYANGGAAPPGVTNVVGRRARGSRGARRACELIEDVQVIDSGQYQLHGLPCAASTGGHARVRDSCRPQSPKLSRAARPPTLQRSPEAPHKLRV